MKVLMRITGTGIFLLMLVLAIIQVICHWSMMGEFSVIKAIAILLWAIVIIGIGTFVSYYLWRKSYE